MSLDGGLATGLDGKSLSASRGGEFARLEALPYPWSDRDGLANVLDDADLWGRIIGDLELRRILLQVSPSAKAGRGLGRRPRARDGDEFGRALVALLADSGQRVAASERLRRELTKRRSPAAIGVPDLLAEAIVFWLCQRGAEGPSARFFPDAITPTILGSGLDATRFAQVLGEGGSPSLEVALMACAQAMLRPGEAPRFAAALLACTPRYERFVVEYGRSTDAAEDGPLEGGTEGIPPEITTVLRQGHRESRRPSHAPPRAPQTEVRAVEPRGLAAVAAAQARTEESAVREDPDHALRAALDAVAAELDAPALFGALSHVLMDAGLDGVAAHQGLADWRSAAKAYAARAEELGEAPVGSLGPRRTLAEWIEELELATMSLEDRLRQRDNDRTLSAALLERVRSSRDEAPVLGADELAALLRGLTSPTVWAHLHSLSAHDEVVSGVFAALAQQDLDRAVALVAPLPPAPLLRVAAGVRLDQLAHVGALHPTLGASLVRATFLAALRADRLAEVAACLAPAVHAGAPGASPVHALIGACIRAQNKGEPVAELLRELGAPTAGSGDPQAGRLLAMIDKPPGMVGIYHRLRLLAQELFFRPLRDLIAARDVAAALTRWRGLGDREEMLATCLYRLPNVAREINDNHVEQTRRYLRNFDEALADWERGGGGLRTRAGVREVVEAWGSLSESESREIRRALEGQEDPGLPVADFGRRFFEDTGDVLCVASDVAIPPELVSSWVRRCRGTAVPFAVYLADQVRLGEGTTIGDTVAEMLRRECYGAALRAAADDAGLLGAVRRQIEVRRRDLEARYAGPLRAARALRAEDPPLEDYLDDLDILLKTLDFVQAEAWLAELADFLRERERERDPIRRGALDFLAELGPVDEFRNEAREDLLARVAEARERHTDRRWQVLALQTLAPGDRLEHLAEEIDRPQLWPTAPDLSTSIAAAIEVVLGFTQAQAQRYRDYDPDTVDRLTAAAGPWLAVVLRDGLPSREGVAPLLDLAAEIHAFAPPRRVAELLSVGPAAAALSAGNAAERRDLALDHYRHGDYRRCQELVADDPEAELIRRCAGVMEMLQRGSPLDIDWLALRGSLLGLRRAPGLTSPLLARLDALDALAEVLVRNKDVPRIIDRLAAPGPRGYDPQDLRALLFALKLHLKVCRHKPPSEAFTLAMVLPEQIFRVWARWHLNLDMTCVPNGRQGVWQLVEEAWDLDGRGARLRRPTPGEPFPSFRCFALFAQLELLVRGRTGAVGVLERSVDDLQAALRVLRIRNDGAHALTRLSDQQHAQYFALITRWLEQLYLACPSIDGRRLRAEVDELLQPLPL